MRLENISLKQFKNYEDLALNFANDIICFVGKNGSGKTNMLDAIHYLSISKSAFNAIDNQNIKHGHNFFSIRGTFRRGKKKYNVQCSLQRKQRKLLKLNDKPYAKITEHIGKFPVVLINPNDTDIIRDGSETRRKFIDSILSQIDPAYLSQLIRYNHALKQRNALLKQFSEQGIKDEDILQPYDQIIITLAMEIHQKRKSYTSEFTRLFEAHYQNLAGTKEKVSMTYQSDVEKPTFTEEFKGSLQKDILLARTNMGIHKDDYGFYIDSYSIKKFGSQGQQKSYVIALKLAQFDIIKSEKGYKPILLLDDIFDKLDELRIKKLMEMLIEDKFGQIFVTDARSERTQTIFAEIASKLTIFEIEDDMVLTK